MGSHASVLIIQLIILFEKWDNSKIDQLCLLYQHNKIIIANHTSKKLTLYSPQKITEQDRLIIDFKNKYPIDTIQIKAFQNTFIKKELKLLVLDGKGIYNIPHFKPSHLLISNDPRMNLDSILLHIHPKMVIADGSNPTWSVSRWKKTCRKHKIPFVNLREKGGYPINL